MRWQTESKTRPSECASSSTWRMLELAKCWIWILPWAISQLFPSSQRHPMRSNSSYSFHYLTFSNGNERCRTRSLLLPGRENTNSLRCLRIFSTSDCGRFLPANDERRRKSSFVFCHIDVSSMLWRHQRATRNITNRYLENSFTAIRLSLPANHHHHHYQPPYPTPPSIKMQKHGVCASMAAVCWYISAGRHPVSSFVAVIFSGIHSEVIRIALVNNLFIIGHEVIIHITHIIKRQTVCTRWLTYTSIVV